MSREIKFRAWKLDGGMHKPFDLTNLVSDEYAGESWLDCGDGLHIDHRTGWDSLKIMQYTGFVDKNGKEIFEGDVVKSNNNHLFVINFKYGSFGANWIKDDFVWHGFATNSFIEKKFEIVGNIYENPKLITEEKWLKTLKKIQF